MARAVFTVGLRVDAHKPRNSYMGYLKKMFFLKTDEKERILNESTNIMSMAYYS
jgi:hypothetical protein